MADYLLLFFIWILSTLIIRTILTKLQSKKKPRLPPGPLALPVIGHLHLLGPLPHQSLHKLSSRHGPLIHLFLGSVPCVVASSAETAKQFLKTYESSFSNRPQISAVDYLTYNSADFSFAPYGPYWKFMKQLVVSELLGGQTLNQLLPIRRDELKRFLHAILQRSQTGQEIDVGGALVRVSNNVISRMMMSTRCSEDENEADEVRKLVKDIAELTGTFNLSDYIWICKNFDLQGMKKRLKEVRDRFDGMMERIIKEHEEIRKNNKNRGGDHDDSNRVKDLLHILLDVYEDQNSEMKLTRENIKAFILDIFAAGTDTSAITAEWAMAELINNPNIMQKAVQEIETVVGKNRVVEESDIVNLPYLQAIVKETLRLHSSPMIVRESSEDCTVNGFDIPAKTQLFVNVWAIGRDPENWESPLEFDPDRFIEGEKKKFDVRGQHFELLPFGSGRRGCPATSLALQFVHTSLGAMIQCFEWRVKGGQNVSMEEGGGLTLPRASPLMCFPVPRLNPFPSF